MYTEPSFWEYILKRVGSLLSSIIELKDRGEDVECKTPLFIILEFHRWRFWVSIPQLYVQPFWPFHNLRPGEKGETEERVERVRQTDRERKIEGRRKIFWNFLKIHIRLSLKRGEKKREVTWDKSEDNSREVVLTKSVVAATGVTMIVVSRSKFETDWVEIVVLCVE